MLITLKNSEKWISIDKVKELKKLPDVLNILELATSDEFKAFKIDRFQEDDVFKNKGEIEEINI
ncbi:MAG: hypothetical protein ACOCTT_02150 [archaeon]